MTNEQGQLHPKP